MAKLSQRDADDLTWFLQEASGEVSGLQAQRYEREGGTSSSDPEKIQDRQLAACKRFRQVNARRDRMLEMDGGDADWHVLAIAFGPPRRDDPVAVYDESTPGKRVLVHAGLPPELAPLARYTPAAKVAGQALLDATEDPNPQIALTSWAADALRRELGHGKKSTGELLLTVQVEAREMLDRAGLRYAKAREELAAEARMEREPEGDTLRSLSGLLERMRAEDARQPV